MFGAPETQQTVNCVPERKRNQPIYQNSLKWLNIGIDINIKICIFTNRGLVKLRQHLFNNADTDISAISWHVIPASISVGLSLYCLLNVKRNILKNNFKMFTD